MVEVNDEWQRGSRFGGVLWARPGNRPGRVFVPRELGALRGGERCRAGLSAMAPPGLTV